MFPANINQKKLVVNAAFTIDYFIQPYSASSIFNTFMIEVWASGVN